jgi:hypothetical protein
MHHIIKFKLFENKDEITMQDYAWLYFIVWVYKGKLPIKSWKNDSRMGVNIIDSLSKFEYISIDENYIIVTDMDKAKKIIDSVFGSKTFEDSLRRSKDMPQRAKNDYWSYPIEHIPHELYMHKHPNLEKAFEVISDRIVDHFNSGRSHRVILDKLVKSRRLNEYNFMKYYNHFDSEPSKFKIYRGLKNGYDESKTTGGYSCWTTDKAQAIRFAKYYFTGQMQFSPSYSDDPHILTSEASLDDVAIFVGGDESEVIMRNPVNNITIEKLKPGPVT